jgi:hypothetical protein
MMNDPIVDEVRNNGLALAARYSNNIEAICQALKERERLSGRLVVDLAPRRWARKSHETLQREEREVATAIDAVTK